MNKNDFFLRILFWIYKYEWLKIFIFLYLLWVKYNRDILQAPGDRLMYGYLLILLNLRKYMFLDDVTLDPGAWYACSHRAEFSASTLGMFPVSPRKALVACGRF